MSVINKIKVVHKECDRSNKAEKVFIIPHNMKKGIWQGKEDVKNGNVFTMEDFDKKYRAFLKKRGA